MSARSKILVAAEDSIFDVAIVGGGVNGACLYDRLCRQGYRTILLDKGDFASGTSQASAMMIWGGLLYLRNLDVATVYKLSRSRDRMIREMGDWVSPRLFRFMPASKGTLGRRSTLCALYLYWLISRCERRRPSAEFHFPEKSLLSHRDGSLTFEEAMLRGSDCRLVLHWIIAHLSPHAVAINHGELVGGDYNARDRLWRLEVRESLDGKELVARARAVVNCGGVWTDRINATFSIVSPFKNAFSKGVFIGFERTAGRRGTLIFDMGQNSDVISAIPWGPLELWGPTETAVTDLADGFTVAPDDVRFLLDRRNRCFRAETRKEDIVSLRCGVRPLAVKASYDGDRYPLDLSRRFRVVVDAERPWSSVYGGKLTDCHDAAETVTRRVAAFTSVRNALEPAASVASDDISLTDFPGLDEPVPTVEWCMKHESCCTLDDYLRRRTNVAQWVPREGLGRTDENLDHLRKLSLELAHGDGTVGERQLEHYRARVTTQFDAVMERV